MAGEIFDPTIRNIERGISRDSKIQEVISQNMANINTPGYVPKRFDEVLNRAVERRDRTTVSLEDEMADMAKNNVEHSALIKILTGKFATLRSIITQGRK